LSKLFVDPATVKWGEEHEVGDSFSVNIYITDVLDCLGVQFKLYWDPAALYLEEAVKGDFLEAEGATTWWLPYYGDNYLLCGYVTMGEGVDVQQPSRGLVAILKFKTLAKKSSILDLNINECLWYDSTQLHGFDSVEDGEFIFAEALPQYPRIAIVNLEKPATAYAGQEISIIADWRNDGEAGTVYTRLIDLDAGMELSRKTFQVSNGETGVEEYLVIMPNRDLRLRVEFGHFE
jgi:hypothetical protein